MIRLSSTFPFFLFNPNGSFSIEQALIALGVFLAPPFLVMLIFIIVFSCFGWSLGIREQYVACLIKIFEWGKERLKEDGGLVGDSSDGASLIRKKCVVDAPTETPSLFKSKHSKKSLNFCDVCDLTRWGLEAIVEDEVTKRFAAEELHSWNLLTRTNAGYQYISIRLTVLWCMGFFFRYFLLLPFRLAIAMLAVMWLVACTAFIGYIPDGDPKRRLNKYVNLMCFRIFARSFSAIVRYHDTHFRPQGGAICVANHTSPIDAVVLAADNCYAFIGQRHGGFLGLNQRALSRASHHIWFERSEASDRTIVTKNLKEHVATPHNLPVLIFPEGTCINNTSVMMFKKGSFEIGCPIYPVAIKYDPRFGDAFWDSSKFSMVQYLYQIMTSWAIVADVTYLPPMERRGSESAVEFAGRVKKEIAKKGGLVQLEWDGGLKRKLPKPEWKEKNQKLFSSMLKAE